MKQRDLRASTKRAAKPEGLPTRQLKLIGWVAVAFGAIATVILSWESFFPVPPENLVEVVWTHQCRCAHGWIHSLRKSGFVVRNFELDSLNDTRQRWHLPSAVKGCHPARFMGYALDGHVPADLIRRLSAERPTGVALLQIDRPGSNAGEVNQFELLDVHGNRRVWP